jgi:hypothetical protein
MFCTQVIFPYDEFLKLYDWSDRNYDASSPCGLVNCGNRYLEIVLSLAPTFAFNTFPYIHLVVPVSFVQLLRQCSFTVSIIHEATGGLSFRNGPL